jgi:hypothetical protein
MQVLREAPFSLLQGQQIVARVAATNLIGTSEYSSTSATYTDVAQVMDVP